MFIPRTRCDHCKQCNVCKHCVNVCQHCVNVCKNYVNVCKHCANVCKHGFNNVTAQSWQLYTLKWQPFTMKLTYMLALLFSTTCSSSKSLGLREASISIVTADAGKHQQKTTSCAIKFKRLFAAESGVKDNTEQVTRLTMMIKQWLLKRFQIYATEWVQFVECCHVWVR